MKDIFIIIFISSILVVGTYYWFKCFFEMLKDFREEYKK